MYKIVIGGDVARGSYTFQSDSNNIGKHVREQCYRTDGAGGWCYLNGELISSAYYRLNRIFVVDYKTEETREYKD